MLRFVEELLLLMLRDEGGTFVRAPARSLRHAIAGAVLMDLAMEDRIDTDLERLFLIDDAPIENSLLDPTLAEIAAAEQRDTQFWVEHTAASADAIRDEALSSLADRGILRRETRHFLWVFRTERYADVEGNARIEVKRRIRRVLLSDNIPEPRDVMLICLAHACGILEALLSRKELSRAVPRIGQLRQMDLIGQAMSRTIDNVESAVTSSLARPGS